MGIKTGVKVVWACCLFTVLPALARTGDWAVRFKAAVSLGGGRQFGVLADGVRWQTGGGDYEITVSTNVHAASAATPGLLGSGEVGAARDCLSFWAGGGQQVRNRFFHDYVLAREGDRFRWWLDGDEMRGTDFPKGAVRGFRLMTNDVGATMANFESVKGAIPGGWVPKNFVINGGFEELQDSYPIGWSTHTFGLGEIADMADMDTARRAFRIDGGAFEGRRCMRLEKTGGRRSYPLWECWRNRPAETDWTYSVYLRADRPDVKVSLMALEGYESLSATEVMPTAEWRRYVLRFRSKRGVSLRVGLELRSEGVLWADAAQLERGRVMTAFETRRFHDIDMPENPPVVADHYLPQSYKAPDKVKAVPPPVSSRVNPSRNSYRLNGKEFFPFGFCVTGRYTGLADWERLLDVFAGNGLNFVEISNEAFPKTGKELRAILDAARKRDIAVGFYCGYDGKSGALKTNQVELAASVREHPALLQVGLYDETWGNFSDKLRADNTAWARRQLGDVPIKFNEFDAGVVTHFNYSVADVASVDMYYVGRQDVSAMYYLVNMLRQDNPNRVVMYYPMAAGRFTSDWMRDATPDEVEAQAYAGFCQEAFNTIWWIGMPLGPSVVPALARVKRERDVIDPSRFLDGKKAKVSCESPDDRVKFTARTDGKTLTVISFNASPAATEAVWSLPFDGEAKVLFENRRVKVRNGTMKDRFAGHGRHVYRIRR